MSRLPIQDMMDAFTPDYARMWAWMDFRLQAVHLQHLSDRLRGTSYVWPSDAVQRIADFCRDRKVLIPSVAYQVDDDVLRLQWLGGNGSVQSHDIDAASITIEKLDALCAHLVLTA